MVNGKSEPTLVSKKVLLRELDIEKDTPQLFIILKNPDIHKWLGTDVPKNVNNVRESIEKYCQSSDLYSWAIVDVETSKTIGFYYLWKPVQQIDGNKIIPAESQRLAKHCWRKGHMKEARKLVYKFAFEELDVQEIHAQAWKNNINSIKSMEYCGYRKYKEEEKSILKYNEKYIECHYVLKRDYFYNSSLIKEN
jgi:RimJ/RimL family protein N-acetyltransferase